MSDIEFTDEEKENIQRIFAEARPYKIPEDLIGEETSRIILKLLLDVDKLKKDLVK